ncbi:MAG: holo-ACP synthase [Patescibacteria group bacterium]
MRTKNVKKTSRLSRLKDTGRFAIGVDVENISRFKEMDTPSFSAFLRKIFTSKELEYCFSKKNSSQHLAVRFAGKEAVIKILRGLGERYLKNPVGYSQIEILNDKNGAPFPRITLPKYKDLNIIISFSHSKEIAIAFAVMIDI